VLCCAGRAGAVQGTVGGPRWAALVTSRPVHTLQVRPGAAVRDPRRGWREACLPGDGAAVAPVRWL